MSLSDDFEKAAGSRAAEYEQAEKDPATKAEHIIERLWNREDDSAENRLSHEEALTLLLYGKDAGHQLIEEEMEHGRYAPDEDVRRLLERDHAERGGHDGLEAAA